jgi:hypothetical protein
VGLSPFFSVARVDVKAFRYGESAGIVDFRVEAFDLVFVGGSAGVDCGASGVHWGESGGVSFGGAILGGFFRSSQ